MCSTFYYHGDAPLLQESAVHDTDESVQFSEHEDSLSFFYIHSTDRIRYTITTHTLYLIPYTPLFENEAKWVDLSTIDVRTDQWMIEDHAKIIKKAQRNLAKFDELEQGGKQQYAFNVTDVTKCIMYEYDP